MTAPAVNTTLSLFAECPLPGCRNPVDDPRWPCGQCEKDLAGYIRPSGAERPAEVVVAELAERDQAVAAVYAERREMTPLPEPEAPAPGLAPAQPAGAGDERMAAIQRAARQDLGEERKPGQLCWVCEERRLCRKDPEFLGTGDERWICKECEAVPA
jgi:hypothetical protein